jgi:anti-anti-sigma factor
MTLASADAYPGIPNHLVLSTRLLAEMRNAGSKFRATTQRDGSAVIVYAGGEIDACNEDTWRHLLVEAAAAVTAPGILVVDTSGLDFMGCCAFSVLADELDLCRQRGVELRLASCQPAVSRIVRACGLGDVLPVYPSVDAALTILAGVPSL